MGLQVHGIANPTPADVRRALVNNFAIRSFRDQADQDYIAARLCHHSGLMPQFMWSAQQAIEKYLKTILLLNRIPGTDLQHDLRRALDRVSSGGPFVLDLSSETNELIDYLDSVGRYRYLEVSYALRGKELNDLDRAVWEIRRYCQVIQSEGLDVSGSQELQLVLAAIDNAREHRPQAFRVPGGLLERVVADRKHPARRPLVKYNLYFGTSRRSSLYAPGGINISNSPLWLHPEILDDVLPYVYFPRRLVMAYREWLEKKAKST